LTLSIHELDELPESEAADLLRSCCGSSHWVDVMVARRPYRSAEALFLSADEIWSSCSRSDWLEAFDHHPRIGGERAEAQSERAAEWSRAEQAGAQASPATVRSELAEVNRTYEEKFGYIYIVCATGKNADEMLSIARGRLENDPVTELRTAAEEQRKITRIRLEKLIGAQS
jgi:OHCU decarboxylase